MEQINIPPSLLLLGNPLPRCIMICVSIHLLMEKIVYLDTDVL